MPFLPLNGGTIHYELSGPERAPALLFSNSLGTDLAMWDPQMPALMPDFRVLRYDTRGHGQSSVTVGPYTIGQLADDVIALLDQLKMSEILFCGLSMGGMIGMSLALRAEHRIRKVVLCSTAPKIGTPETWNMRIGAVQKGGMAAVVDGVLRRWYTTEFHSTSPQAIESTKQTLLKTPTDGYVACCAAIRDADFRDSISGIHVPALIITGAYDPVTTPADGHFMAARIPGAEYRELTAAHLSNIEASTAFTRELCAFLKA